MGRLSGKAAIVTGAAYGIGAGVAEHFAAAGARVAVADIDVAAAERRAASIRHAGGDAIACDLDIGDPASIDRLVATVEERFGAVDVLCNNAAATKMAAERDGPIATMDLEVWDTTMRVNLRGTMLMCKRALPGMVERRTGSIVNVASNSGLSGDLSHSAYGISKAAVIHLTRYIATQHGRDGVRCNVISPGFIVTPEKGPKMSEARRSMMQRHHLTPRLGTPADIAAAALYLASDESGFVTGQVMSVDGGSLAHAPYYADTLAPAG